MRIAEEGFCKRCVSTTPRAERKARPREESVGPRRRLAIGAEVTGDSEPTICVHSGREASPVRVAAGAKVHERVAARHVALRNLLCKRRDCSEKDHYSQPYCFLHRLPPINGLEPCKICPYFWRPWQSFCRLHSRNSC